MKLSIFYCSQTRRFETHLRFSFPRVWTANTRASNLDETGSTNDWKGWSEWLRRKLRFHYFLLKCPNWNCRLIDIKQILIVNGIIKMAELNLPWNCLNKLNTIIFRMKTGTSWAARGLPFSSLTIWGNWSNKDWNQKMPMR